MIRWWQGEEKILYIFALYGLAAGILSYIASLSYDDQFTEGIAATANFPSLMILLSIEWFVMNPNGFSILNQSTIIPGSIVIWSFIGLTVYYFIKMFKMGP